jgi:hypothetical protein
MQAQPEQQQKEQPQSIIKSKSQQPTGANQLNFSLGSSNSVQFNLPAPNQQLPAFPGSTPQAQAQPSNSLFKFPTQQANSEQQPSTSISNPKPVTQTPSFQIGSLANPTQQAQTPQKSMFTQQPPNIAQPQQQKPQPVSTPNVQPQSLQPQKNSLQVQTQQKLVQQQQMTNNANLGSVSSATRIKEFSSELEELKANAAKLSKLFKDKDSAKKLVNISVVKDTRKVEEDFLKLDEEFKVSFVA